MFAEIQVIIKEKRTAKKSDEVMDIFAVNEASVGQKLMENSSHLHEG